MARDDQGRGGLTVFFYFAFASFILFFCSHPLHEMYFVT